MRRLLRWIRRRKRDQWTVTLHGPGWHSVPVKVDMVPGGPDGKYLVNAGEITFTIPEEGSKPASL